MCFSPKIKMPKTDTTKIADPAPLTEEVQGVEFGSTKKDDEDTSENTSESKGSSGKSSLKVDLKKPTNGGAKRMSVKSRMGGK